MCKELLNNILPTFNDRKICPLCVPRTYTCPVMNHVIGNIFSHETNADAFNGLVFKKVFISFFESVYTYFWDILYNYNFPLLYVSIEPVNNRLKENILQFQFTEDEIGRTCGTCEGDDGCINNFTPKPGTYDYSGDQRADGRIILKRVLLMVWTESN